ncbi:MAG TPA: HEAT repeat domain-containing protein, partial [Gemmatimonadaceae bacterium]|nr:HEAT repeat domain-containing protein [Gemmatimonadaceae bacterium]
MNNAAAQSIEADLDEAPFPPALVVEALRLFAKAIRAHQLYLPNNPMHVRAMEAAREGFRTVWDETDTLTLSITEAELKWLERTVLDEPGRTSDSIPWMFYKDGVRELMFRKGFEDEELILLLALVQRARLASAEDDDLLTLLWEQEFVFLQYKYVDLAIEGSHGFEHARDDGTARIAAPRAVEADAHLLASSSITRMDEYDSTLYFLDDREIDYLQAEIRKDFSGDLRAQVVSSLLDTYELESDPAIRDEIAGILDNLFLLLLSITQFRTAAFLIREAAITAARSRDLLLNQKQRLMQLSDRLSERETFEQLLHALEETPLRPPQDDLQELFGQLKAGALETLLSWLGRSRNSELRALLETAGSRLAAAHTSELVRLISSDDEVVAFEAIRRAGAMKATPAVAALAAVIAQGSPELRLAGVTALSDIGSPGALQVLERALEDEDRDIRIATVKVLGSRNHRAAVDGIENHIKTPTLRAATLAEKMAFFESYGTLCGEDGVSFLNSILNTRSLLGRREDAELRACAAMALGRVGT